MALIFPEDLLNGKPLAAPAKSLLVILEQGLSDEWEFYTYQKDGQICHFLVTNPEFGVFSIIVCNTAPDNLSRESIVALMESEKVINTVRTTLANDQSLVDLNGNLRFPVSSGVIFTHKPLDPTKINEILKELVDRSLIIDTACEGVKFTDIDKYFISLSTVPDFKELSTYDVNAITRLLPGMHETLSSQLHAAEQETKAAEYKVNKLLGEVHTDNDHALYPFINHLELLGYEIKKSESAAERACDVLVCNHPTEYHYTLLIRPVNGFILIQAYLPLDGGVNNFNRKDALEAINIVNNENLSTCALSVDEYNVRIRMSLTNHYEKVAFGRAIEVFKKDYDNAYNIISKRLNLFEEIPDPE